MLKKFVVKKISTIEIPKSSKLHCYVNRVRKLYHARYKCNNKRDPKIINLNKMAIAGFQCHAIQNRLKSKSKPFDR